MFSESMDCSGKALNIPFPDQSAVAVPFDLERSSQLSGPPKLIKIRNEPGIILGPYLSTRMSFRQVNRHYNSSVYHYIGAQFLYNFFRTAKP
jgi:hypothetical protein